MPSRLGSCRVSDLVSYARRGGRATGGHGGLSASDLSGCRGAIQVAADAEGGRPHAVVIVDLVWRGFFRPEQVFGRPRYSSGMGYSRHECEGAVLEMTRVNATRSVVIGSSGPATRRDLWSSAFDAMRYDPARLRLIMRLNIVPRPHPSGSRRRGTCRDQAALTCEAGKCDETLSRLFFNPANMT